jgi:hypothetical protein
VSGFEAVLNPNRSLCTDARAALGAEQLDVELTDGSTDCGGAGRHHGPERGRSGPRFGGSIRCCRSTHHRPPRPLSRRTSAHRPSTTSQEGVGRIACRDDHTTCGLGGCRYAVTMRVPVHRYSPQRFERTPRTRAPVAPTERPADPTRSAAGARWTTRGRGVRTA